MASCRLMIRCRSSLGTPAAHVAGMAINVVGNCEGTHEWVRWDERRTAKTEDEDVSEEKMIDLLERHRGALEELKALLARMPGESDMDKLRFAFGTLICISLPPGELAYCAFAHAASSLVRKRVEVRVATKQGTVDIFDEGGVIRDYVADDSVDAGTPPRKLDS